MIPKDKTAWALILNYQINCQNNMEYPLGSIPQYLTPPLINIDDITVRWLETQHVSRDMIPQ